MTRTPSNRVGSLISRRWPSPRTAVLAALPGHAQGLGDTRHRQMMNDHTRERPSHRRPRELGARIGRLIHILAPHVSALRAPVAAHAHVQDRGTPPAGVVRQAPDYRVTSHALTPAASTPPILTNDAASQHCMVWPHALASYFQAQVIQVRERAQVRAIKGSIGHVEVFRMDGVGTPIIGRPRPLPGHDTPNPARHPTPAFMKSRIQTLTTLQLSSAGVHVEGHRFEPGRPTKRWGWKRKLPAPTRIFRRCALLGCRVLLLFQLPYSCFEIVGYINSERVTRPQTALAVR